MAWVWLQSNALTGRDCVGNRVESGVGDSLLVVKRFDFKPLKTFLLVHNLQPANLHFPFSLAIPFHYAICN